MDWLKHKNPDLFYDIADRVAENPASLLKTNIPSSQFADPLNLTNITPQ